MGLPRATKGASMHGVIGAIGCGCGCDVSLLGRSAPFLISTSIGLTHSFSMSFPIRHLLYPVFLYRLIYPKRALSIIIYQTARHLMVRRSLLSQVLLAWLEHRTIRTPLKAMGAFNKGVPCHHQASVLYAQICSVADNVSDSGRPLSFFLAGLR